MDSNTNMAQSVEDEMRKMALERIQYVTTQIADDLLGNAERDIAKLPEDVFVTHFLPVFSGEKTLVGNNDTLAIWLGIAGSHSSEVSIIDNKGQELYRVPPITDTSHINAVDRDAGNSFADITAMSMLYSNNIMAEGERYLTNQVERKITEIVTPPNMSNKERWDAIMRRYNKLPNDTKPNSISSQETEDLIDYDDN